MHTNQIKYFLEVAEYGSMLKVAEQNFITQPAVSSAISNLEKELDVKLIHRTKRGVTLTEAGKIVHAGFLSIQQQLSDLSAAVNPYRENQSTFPNQTISSIKLCATLEITNTMLHNITAQFYKIYPNCTVHIKEYDFWDVIAAVQDGNADFGAFYILDEILNSSKFQNILQQHELCIEEIGQDALAVGVARKSPLSRKKSISLKELSQNRIVAYNSSPESCWQKQFLEQYNSNLHIILTNSLTYCGELMENRDYLAFFLNRNQLLFSEEAQHSFKILPVKENKKVTIAMIYKDESAHKHIAKELLSLLKSSIHT